jgi:class 3 adenylate cyclase
VAVVGLLAVGGMVLSGCAPAPEEPTGPAPSGPEVSGPPPTTEEPTAEEELPAEQAAKEAEPAPEEQPGKEKKAGRAPEVADLDLAPPVSEFAPAEDLVAQVSEYVEELEECVESEEEYQDSVEKLAKQSNTLILIAVALGLHDSDNQYKTAAPAMLKAAQQLAAAEDYGAAKAAVEAFKQATTSTAGDPPELKWGRLASLPEIMKAVPLINTKMKRPLRSESRLERSLEDVTGHSAVLAVIAQGSLDSAGETEKPNEVGTWQALCVAMRDAAAEVNAAARRFGEAPSAEGYEKTKAAVEALNQNCEDCHEVFKPDVATTE